MKKRCAKTLIAALLTVAMLLTGVSTTLVNGTTASAAKKKVTLKLKKTKVSVGKGKKVTLKITKKNVKKIKSKKWSSKNKKIATVSKKGVVTGKKAGKKTTISCKVKYIAKGSKKVKTKTLKCTVTVKKASATPTQTTKPSSEPTRRRLTKMDNTSNKGDAREVKIVGGTSDKMTIYDNGSMRKDLTSQYLIKNEMGQGINLGNTMEACKAVAEKDNFTNATDFEQAWGMPITTQKMIDGMQTYGINTLRVPVAWSSMVSKDGKYTIDEKMLGRVEEIINYGLNDGMYVIVNIHWDYGWWGQFGSSDPQIVQNAWARYESFWKQISERYKDYSDHLIFESANEELCGALNYEIDETGYRADNFKKDAGILETAQTYEMTNKINQKFVDIVRASGGNNANRHLLIAGYQTDIGMTSNSQFVMPNDTDENGVSKLSLSVHYYTPWDFCGDDAGKNYQYKQSDKDKTVRTFALLEKFQKAGYGIILGEYAVCNPRQDKVIDWLYDVMVECEKYNVLPVLWDYNGMYYDRDKCQMMYKDVAELFNQVTGAKGDTSMTAKTGKRNIDVNNSFVDVSDYTAKWQWEGLWAKNDAKNIGLDGQKVETQDVTKFVQQTSCTDDSKIEFNSWGYQTFLKLDWSQYKKPVIYATFEKDNETKVGNFQLAATSRVDGPLQEETKYEYKDWHGKGIVISDEILTQLKGGENSILYLTFGAAPIVTGIYVYDLG